MVFVPGSSSTGGGSLQNRYCGGFLTDGQVSLSKKSHKGHFAMALK